MGGKDTIAQGPDVASVRAAMFDDLVWLIAGRGRGPRAGQRRPARRWGEGLSPKEYLAELDRRLGTSSGSQGDDAPPLHWLDAWWPPRERWQLIGHPWVVRGDGTEETHLDDELQRYDHSEDELP
jgi:hypothetical protein